MTLVLVRRAFVACRSHACDMLQHRLMSAGPKLAPVAFTALDGGGQLAKITMNYPPANLFDSSSLQALGAAMDTVEATSDVRGLVLQSDVRGFFSAGFSLPALYNVDRAGFERLWVTGKHVFRRIYALPVPSIAAIDGHALGLGCVMAMACQRRFMVASERPPLIGLNEVAVGMPVPEWLATRFRDLTSTRDAELILPRGSSLSPTQAHKIGLVDSLYASRSEMDDAIHSDFNSCRVSARAQQETIRGLRRQFLDYFDTCFDQDTELFWQAISSHETQTAIGNALAQLKAKSRKPN
ncbi:hypothetical protein H4S00_006517 [Coemansia sp. D1744]|nr:hypothetical protein GGH97_005724 [Coemansia sp. RSA 475]KAJ2709903.1 hypothetical protein H4S00_006517 [Coemansia sp. D1744]